MKNNILFEITFEDPILSSSATWFEKPILKSILFEAEKNSLYNLGKKHENNLRLLDFTYGLEKMDFVCLKVLGCLHKSLSLLDKIQGYGSSHVFCPEYSSQNKLASLVFHQMMIEMKEVFPMIYSKTNKGSFVDTWQYFG